MRTCRIVAAMLAHAWLQVARDGGDEELSSPQFVQINRIKIHRRGELAVMAQSVLWFSLI
jgi:hypothetical protein